MLQRLRKSWSSWGVGGLFFAVLGLGGAAAFAASSPWADNEQARLRLITAQEGTGDGDSVAVGLHFQIQPGWKIYWRSPGDAGYPPSIDWGGSENLASAQMKWPVPHRFSLFGLETFGYSDQVVFPIVVRPARPGQGIRLHAAVDYLICKEICIPRQATLSLDMAPGPAAPSREAALIENFRMKVPGEGPAGGLSLEGVVLTGSVEDTVVEARGRAEAGFRNPDVLIEAPPGFSFAKPEIVLGDGGKTAVLRVAATATGGGVLEGKPLTVTLTNGERGVERAHVYLPGPRP